MSTVKSNEDDSVLWILDELASHTKNVKLVLSVPRVLLLTYIEDKLFSKSYCRAVTIQNTGSGF